MLRVGGTEVSAVGFWNSVAVGVHFVNALSILVLASANERNPVYHLTYEGLYYTRAGNSSSGDIVFAGDTDMAVTIDTSVLPSHKFGPDITVYATLLQSEALAVSVPGVVVAFFTLSAVFQGLYTNSFRFVEYSFSASIMVLLMMLQVGIWNAYAVLSIVFLTGVCMLLGYLADTVHKLEIEIKQDGRVSGFRGFQVYGISGTWMVPLKWQLHFLGWVALLPPFVFLWTAYATALAENPSVQWWITVIIVVETLLFLSFGFVQMLELRSSESGGLSETTAKLVYIGLSLVAKTLLGWIVASETLMG
eukprot:1466593-Rhodomonas_salina.2